MNVKLKIAISSILALSYSSVYSETLQNAVQHTINENPQIQSAKSERLAVEQEISQAKAGYFPTVDITVGAGWERSFNSSTKADGSESKSLGRDEASIQVRQMIYDGFATASEVNRQTARTNSRAYTVFGQAEITALNAIEAYINVLRREELLALAEENLAVHQSTNEQISSRSSRGVGRRADVEQSTGRLSLAQKNVLSEVGNLKDAQTAYLRVVGRLPSELEPINPPENALPATFDQAVDSAIANHPILKSANSDIKSAIAQHATAKTAFLPRIDLELSATHDKNIDGIEEVNEDAAAMLRLRYNLFNGGKDAARRKETAQLINQAKSIRDNTYRQAVESMRLSWIAHQTVKNQMAFFESHRDSSIKSSEAYQKQFNIGRRSLLDLLDSANEMFVAKSAYTNAKYDELFSQFRILASAGALNNYLNIALPEETTVLPEVQPWIGASQRGKVTPTYSATPE
ncbi:TolC family outer membrane protein [Cycloclasticus zancles]|jgi:adhesin transport system outer membrane protein|uniref:Type I secretion system outer membrane protein n=1 Tax=Cycloclasticus zancles 78-ME TaxID=1198232 RepID=S5TUP1_9GAMM|nr:TolC family outer membrane protein [Cycloclasticus zancles]AGS38738.1 Type I secretion system outer membrane protein [Cycloclasticus zancles 78-ME]